MWNNTAVTQAFLMLTQKLRQNSQTRAAESAGELQRAIKQTPQRHNMGHSAQDTQPLNFQRRVSLLRKQMFTFWMA